MIPLSTSIVSGVAISKVNGQPKILLMKRVKGGYWCHVAGSIEGSENGCQAIIREFKEETQIEVRTLYNAHFIDKFYEPHVNVFQMIPVFAIYCPDDQPVTLNEEHTEYQWCSLEEAIEITPFPGQHAVYRHVWSYFIDNEPDPLLKIPVIDSIA
ncbi:DNA mismatch repair protein MutT [Vibrio genomosp. F10 str. ZF-129]|uniref:DNA mismatch repair protein MutT n=1 Tax=Vibrio genomosp. F10 str. ZF-129 TaxID=1187848 RepID=A0A1E5BCY1_9VIBR|nr:NUDIX domain-containing protein [Vibrio genomosp. F10]OEE32690.1 DNA mismatch repair protein MutT [Vibrio genomosp. F10 str. ZF-129]